MTDVNALRRHLIVRHRRAMAVRQRFGAFTDGWRAHPEAEVKTLELGCDAGSGGHHPVLAKVYVVDEGLLFRSRITWLAVDRLHVPPWEIDAYMASAVDNLDLSSDDAVRSFASFVATLRTPKPDDDRRWIKRRPEFVVDDVLDLPAEDGDGWLPDLWMRCRRHPGDREASDRQRLIAAARAA